METEIRQKIAEQKERLAEEARKWELLGELLQEPDIHDFLASEFSRNGTSPTAVKQAYSERTEPSDAEEKRTKKGTLVNSVASYCLQLPGPPHTFTAWDVFKKMRDAGFKFNAKSPELAVAQTLKKLTSPKHHKLKVARNGSGRRATWYQRIDVS